jgi:hypothetical protein
MEDNKFKKIIIWSVIISSIFDMASTLYFSRIYGAELEQNLVFQYLISTQNWVQITFYIFMTTVYIVSVTVFLLNYINKNIDKINPLMKYLLFIFPLIRFYGGLTWIMTYW